MRKFTRSTQFVPAAEYVDEGLLPEPPSKKEKDSYAQRGSIHVPASATHGGVIATGGVRRDATLSLAALRLLAAGDDDSKTLALRRYVLGRALSVVEVYGDGRREPAKVTHPNALAYATAAAKDFGVGEDRTVESDKERAKKDVQGDAASGSGASKKTNGKKPAK